MRLSHLIAGLGMLLVFATSAAAQQRRPVVERIEPTSGPVGTTVQLVGRDFDASATVVLGETPLEVLSRTPNRWSVRIPAGATSGEIVFRYSNAEYLAGDFRVTAAAAPPRVTAIAPTSGAPGTEVTITGENFSPRLSDNAVTIAGRTAVVRGATPTSLSVTVPEGATSGPVRVRVSGIEVEGPAFTVGARTAITSFEPTVGPPGTRVVVRGAGFATKTRDNRVYVNNVVARVSRATESELEITVPRDATTGRILVDVQGGGRTESTASFTVRELPRLDSFTPASGAPGTSVTLRGSRFGTDVRAVAVTIGSTAATVRTVAENEITVDIPQGAATGRFSVTVGGLGPATSRNNFSVTQPLAITAFEPRNGPVGTEVKIRGTGFSTSLGQNVVSLGTTRARVTSASATELEVRIPDGAASGTLSVEVGGATARTTEAFVVTRPPSVSGFSPLRGAVGAEVTVRGTGFGTNAQLVEVTLNGRPMQVRSIGNEQLVAVVPEGATSGRIAVTVRLQGTGLSGGEFRVDAAFGVSGIAPETAPVNTEITIRGEGFDNTARVTFAGVTAPVAPRFVSATELRATIPNGTTSGRVTVTQRGRSATSTATLTIGATPSAVTVTGIEPACTHQGCDVVIRGTGFNARTAQNRVRFGGRPVRVRSATATELHVQIPNGVTGSHPFEIDVRQAGTASTPALTVTAQ